MEGIGISLPVWPLYHELTLVAGWSAAAAGQQSTTSLYTLSSYRPWEYKKLYSKHQPISEDESSCSWCQKHASFHMAVSLIFGNFFKLTIVFIFMVSTVGPLLPTCVCLWREHSPPSKSFHFSPQRGACYLIVFTARRGSVEGTWNCVSCSSSCS
jgi:hypothetical protein